MPKRVRVEPGESPLEKDLTASLLDIRLSPGFSARLDGEPILGWSSRSDELLAFLILTTETDSIPIGTIAATLKVDPSRIRHACGDLRLRVGEGRIYYDDNKVRFRRAPGDTIDLWDYAALANQDPVDDVEALGEAVSFWEAGLLQFETTALTAVEETRRSNSRWAWTATHSVGSYSFLTPYRRVFERAAARLAQSRLARPTTSDALMDALADAPFSPLPDPPDARDASTAAESPPPRVVNTLPEGELYSAGTAFTQPPPTQLSPLVDFRANPGRDRHADGQRSFLARRAVSLTALAGVAALGVALFAGVGKGGPFYAPGERLGHLPDPRYQDAQTRVSAHFKMGYPIEPVQEFPDGSFQRYAGGEHGPGLLGAAYTAGTVFWIDGEIYKKYFRPLQRNETGPLRKRIGFPKSDVFEEPCPPFQHTGIRALFDRGLIATHSNGRYQGKAYAIEGAIYLLFATYGLGSGALGYPISDEGYNQMGARESQFEGGVITSIDGGHSYRLMPHRDLERYVSGE